MVIELGNNELQSKVQYEMEMNNDTLTNYFTWYCSKKKFFLNKNDNWDADATTFNAKPERAISQKCCCCCCQVSIIMHPSKRFAQTVERPAKPIVRGRTNNQPTNQYLFNFLTVDIFGQSKAGILRSLLLIQNV
jgi:hypothetical protein